MYKTHLLVLFLWLMKRFIFIHWFVYFHTLTLSISTVKWSEVTQSCLTLCYPVDCSPPGSSVHGIFQARVLEWVAISFSRGSSQPRDRTQVSHIAGRCFNLWAIREVHKYFFEPPFSCGGARILEWLAIPFSRRSSRPMDWTWVSRL